MKLRHSTHPRIWLAIALAVCALYADDASAQRKKSKAPAVESKADTSQAKKTTVAEKIKGHRKIDGLFTVYQDTASGSVQLFIKKNQVGNEFIYQSFSMGGPPSLFLNQNMLRETWIFNIRKSFNKIEFMRGNAGFYYDPANAVSKAANVDVSESMFFSEKIVAENAEGYLIAADGLFLSERLDPVKPFLPPTLPPGSVFTLGTLNTAKSGYIKVRSFPNNTDVVVSLSYDNITPYNFGTRDITDARFVEVKMQHSFIEIPKNDYRPRYDDPRVGYFTQQVDDLTSYDAAPYRDLIHRWHLKKKDPNAPISEPVEPIVWWVENTTPVELRETIVQAGLKWNEAFEKAGFRNAVVMKIMPDTATWDPADIRYNVIRWVSSNLGYAIGPSFVNPRTGQILGADITIDYGIMQMTAGEEALFDAYHAYTQPQAAHHALPQHLRNCAIANGLSMQLGASTAVVEALDDNPNELKKLREQFLTFLVLHEMGHTMGLNHNMKASQMLSPAQLQDREVTRSLGVTGSCMDYPAANVSLDRSRQADYFTTRTGPYDNWAIEFGYTPFGQGTENEGLRKILARSTDPKLIFGNDADITSPGSGVDPRVMVWDMSGDMITYAEDRFKLLNATMVPLKDRMVKNGKSYQDLRQKYYVLNGQRFHMAISLSNYIGGVYVDRSFPEQQSVNKPLTPVPAAEQKKAMKLIGKYIFAPNAFDADSKLFPYLQLQRRGFDFFNRPEDPKLQQHVLGLQTSVLQFILHPVTLQRTNNTTLYGNSYSSAIVLSDLVSVLFDADILGSVNMYRQNIQTEFVSRLAQIMSDPLKQYDNPSKAAAHHALSNLYTTLKRTSAGDMQTKAHRKNLSFLIEKALSPDR